MKTPKTMKVLCAIVMVGTFLVLPASMATEPKIEDIGVIQVGRPPDFSKLPLVTPLISKLKAGEAVEIRITTQHCFGGNTYALRLSGPPPLRVLVYGDRDAAVEGQLPFLGHTTLTLADAVRVDRVLAYYRTGPEFGCTAYSTVTADWKLQSGTKSEAWFDDSCAVADSEITLSLFAVARKAAKETP